MAALSSTTKAATANGNGTATAAASSTQANVVAPAKRGDYYDGDDENSNGAGYAWEGALAKSWEDVEEDETGSLKARDPLAEQRTRKKRLESQSTRVIEKGMIRYMYIIIDLSVAMDVTDLKPTRKGLTLDLLESFIKEFFDQNPISQLGFIVTYSKIAEKVTELSGNPLQQLTNLRSKAESVYDGGDISLQNALDIANASLSQIPSYGSREIVVIMASLGTCDPGDIHTTIQSLKDQSVRCSVISLSAEVYVCKHLANVTGGTFSTALNRDHYHRLLFQHVPPLPTAVSSRRVARKWIHMGFPQKKTDVAPSLCACHGTWKYDGYLCPRCGTKFCELPTDCRICSLTLVSSPHLARSYHHLFPVAPFTEAPTGWSTMNCFACQQYMTHTTHLRLVCPRCNKHFCVDCDDYIHNMLHNCPGCESTAAPLSSSSSSSSTSAASSSLSSQTIGNGNGNAVASAPTVGSRPLPNINPGNQ